MKISWPRIRLVVSAGLIFWAAWLYVVPIAPFGIEKWVPLDIPLRIEVGEIRTPEFVGGFDADYALRVQTLPMRNAAELPCLLGLPSLQAARSCEGIPNMIEMDWQVFSGEQLVTGGSSASESGGYFAREITRTIGKFRVRRGEAYSLVLKIRKDGGILNFNKPRLLVECVSLSRKDTEVGWMIDRDLRPVWAFLLGALGSLTLLLPPLVRRLRKSKRGPGRIGS